MIRAITVLLFACGHPAAGPSALPRPLPPLTIEILPAEGASAMEELCDEGATERANALDDDCDGVIDEGFGGHAADVQIALAWSTGADLDLGVSRAVEHTPSRAACAQPAEPSIERAFAEASRGDDIVVELRHFEACGHDGPVTASVAIVTTGARALYNRTFAPGERVHIATVRSH